jgi:uncharacterized repeat protein (TIGR01451 family)
MKLFRSALIALCAAASALVAVPGPVSADPPPPLDMIKSFDDSSVPLFGTTTLRLELTNNSGISINDAGFFDQLPDELAILSDTGDRPECGGTLHVSFQGVVLEDGHLDDGENCAVEVTVTGLEAGVFTNTAEATPGGDEASADLAVVAPPTVAKSFSPAIVRNGGTTTLTVTLTNPNTTTTLTEVRADDVLPSGMRFASPANETTTCGGNVDLTLGIADQLALTDGTIAPGASCTISASVTVRGAGTVTNNAAATSLESGDPQGFPQRLGEGSGSVFVLIPPRLTKQFGATSISVNQSTSLTFTLNNQNPSTTLSGITFTDELPSGLAYADTSPTPTCGGTLEAHTNGLILTDATLGGGASCSFPITVTGTTIGLKHNVTSHVSSAQTEDGDGATADLLVTTPPTLTKSFAAETVPLNGTVRMALDVSNENSVTLTGLAVSDSMPSSLVVASPVVAFTTCGGSLTAAAGTSLVALTGGTVAANGTCTIGVDVTPTSAGNVTNTAGPVSSANAGTGNTASDSVSVVQRPAITKTFGADTVPLGGTTSLTIVVSNPDLAVTQTGVAFTDTLPAGLVVATAPNGVISGCGGTETLTAVAGSNTISLSGAAIAPTAQCTIRVDVTGSTVGAKDNTVTASSNQGGTGAPASDTLTVVGPPTIAKSFGAPSIPLNGTTRLMFTIGNSNLVSFSGLAFSDSLPPGLEVASPSGGTNGCGGTLTAAPGSGTISLANGVLAPALACQVAVDVRGTLSGVKNNVSGAVSSTEGGTGGTASASLAVVAPPSITKAFGKSVFPIGSTTSLTLTITNPNAGTALSAVGFSDSLPAGLVVNSPNGLSSTCGGTATAVAGSGSVSLSGGSLPASGSCTVSLSVKGTTAGTKNNTSGAVTSTEGGTGNTASASVIVALPPSLTKAFGAGSVRVGQTTSLTFTITNPNTTTSLSGMTFSDPFPSGLMVAASPSVSNTCGGVPTVGPFALAVGYGNGTIPAGGSCTFKVNVTATSTGVKNNVTTIISSTQGGVGSPASASVTVTP